MWPGLGGFDGVQVEPGQTEVRFGLALLCGLEKQNFSIGVAPGLP